MAARNVQYKYTRRALSIYIGQGSPYSSSDSGSSISSSSSSVFSKSESGSARAFPLPAAVFLELSLRGRRGGGRRSVRTASAARRELAASPVVRSRRVGPVGGGETRGWLGPAVGGSEGRGPLDLYASRRSAGRGVGPGTRRSRGGGAIGTRTAAARGMSWWPPTYRREYCVPAKERNVSVTREGGERRRTHRRESIAACAGRNTHTSARGRRRRGSVEAAPTWSISGTAAPLRTGSARARTFSCRRRWSGGAVLDRERESRRMQAQWRVAAGGTEYTQGRRKGRSGREREKGPGHQGRRGEAATKAGQTCGGRPGQQEGGNPRGSSRGHRQWPYE